MKSRTLLCSLALSLAWSYFLSVFLLEKSLFGISFRLAYFFPVIIASVALIYSGLHTTTTKQMVSWSRLMDVTSMVLVTLLSLLTLTLDIACISTYSTRNKACNMLSPLRAATRSTNSILASTTRPRRSFYLHKPEFTATGEHYGELYSLELMKSQTLATSVFELHPVSISIDKYGFRETTLPTETEIFSLGDSFTFGWGVLKMRFGLSSLKKRSSTRSTILG